MFKNKEIVDLLKEINYKLGSINSMLKAKKIKDYAEKGEKNV